MFACGCYGSKHSKIEEWEATMTVPVTPNQSSQLNDWTMLTGYSWLEAGWGKDGEE